MLTTAFQTGAVRKVSAPASPAHEWANSVP
jgi:hypothetical protein